MENLALNSQFYESLECPICYDYYTPPITLCPNGHSVCTNCIAKSVSCPICRSQLNRNSRNIALENILEQITVPCKFENCTEITSLAGRVAHYSVCKYNNTVKCIECKIDQSDLLKHLIAEHGYKEILMDNAGGIRSFSGPFESWRDDTVWPRGIWRLNNEPLVVHAKSKKGIFHIYLYRFSQDDVKVVLNVQNSDFSIKFTGKVPSVSEFEQNNYPHFNCDVSILLKNFLKMHEEDPEILRLWVNVKRK